MDFDISWHIQAHQRSRLGPSLQVKRNLGPFLKRVFAPAFEFAFTFKFIPFSFKSNLGLKLSLVLKLMVTLRLIVLKRTISRTTPTK